MKSIRMDFIRSGEETAILEKGRTYLVVIESSRHRQFKMPLKQEEFLDRLAELRYHDAISKRKRKSALRKLSKAVTKILEPPEAPPEALQLDLVTNAHELWALPFEAALASDGEPLFARREPVVVLTRRMPQQFAERQPNWPSRPRVLFAYASPKWFDGPAVESSAHNTALLEALQPWVEPRPGLPMIIGEASSVLTPLKDASLSDIAQACRKAEAEGKPYTHVHLLAHGIKCQDPVYSHKTQFGIALCSDDEKATMPEALVRALLPPDRQGQELPLVVTLAICDSGNAENTIIESGGLAQELHRAGVPIVIASQLPLTFRGSEIMTGVFYEGWMAGKDVRSVLHETRAALYEAKDAGHDWVSMVAYVRLPEGYNDYLLDVRLKSQLAALETASKHANYLLEKNITDGAQYDQVTDRLRRRVKHLEQLLKEHEAAAHNRRREIIQENAGQLGSAYKRLAELLANRAASDPERHEHWVAESRSALAKARDVYQEGFRRNPAHHWTGVQYLALDTILTGKVSSVADWYACYVAAIAERDHPESREEDRIWALGSIAELVLLAPLATGLTFSPEEDAAAITDLYKRVKAAPDLFPDLSPIDSTRRQLMRYVKWWIKTNGFFGVQSGDLAQRARELAELLNS